MESAGSQAKRHEMSPSSNRVGSLVLEEIACGERRGNAVQLAVPSGGSWMNAWAEAAAAAAVVAPEGIQTFWRCGWVFVAYPGQQDSGGTLSDTKRTPRLEITEKHHGKPRQPAK